MDGLDVAILSLYRTAKEQSRQSPSIREVAAAVRISVGEAHKRVRSLTNTGYLSNTGAMKRAARSYSITGTGQDVISNYYGRSGKDMRQWPPT